jgi:acyl-CoA thioesterase I
MCLTSNVSGVEVRSASLRFKVLPAQILVIAGLLAALALPARAETIKIVGFGDSLMAAYDLAKEDGFPARLEAALRERGHDVEITDAGVSGDTTSGGLSRLDWSVPDGTDGVILELGANDALRGIAPEKTRENLDAMIERLKERGIPVLLAGMLAPPNMGPGYEETFNAIYPELAEKHDLVLYPFFLDGVAGETDMVLSDGMHPNPAGVDEMVRRFVPVAEEFIARIEAEHPQASAGN